MAAVLDQLRPLAALLGQAADAGAALSEVQLAVSTLDPGAPGTAVSAALAARVFDGRLAAGALTHAGVLDGSGRVAPGAGIRLAQVEVLLDVAAAGAWQLVLTVPGFLRPSFDALVAEYGDQSRPVETEAALRQVASVARRRLLIAAPYLHESFVSVLAPSVQRVLTGGGHVVVVTRALALTAPQRSTANVAAVGVLREAAARAGGSLVTHSWEESGLGVHFKVVLADDKLAYLGSANLTPGGTGGHAEAGVLLRGDGVDGLARWLDAVCAELARRRLPHG